MYRDPGVVRSEDKVDEVVRTDTARKMLSIFRQMEEKATKEEVPEGPKPLKRFTPPPEDKLAKHTASESEEEETEEEESEEDEADTRDPNYVRASDKVSFVFRFWEWNFCKNFGIKGKNEVPTRVRVRSPHSPHSSRIFHHEKNLFDSTINVLHAVSSENLLRPFSITLLLIFIATWAVDRIMQFRIKTTFLRLQNFAKCFAFPVVAVQ